MMRPYRVELRAIPDTPKEEQHAKQQGRTLGPQTVIYPHIWANSPEEAAQEAIESQKQYMYRKKIWLFCEPIPSEEYSETLAQPMPVLRLVFERD